MFVTLLAFCEFDSLKRVLVLIIHLCNEKRYKGVILSGLVCSLLTQANEASSALSLRVKNNDGYPASEAENWLFMKLSARSCDTGWIQSVTCMKRQR